MHFLTLLLPLLASLISAYDPSACNNSPTLCPVKYDKILHIGAHNSAFVRNTTNSFSIAGNQYFPAPIQLSGGIRLLQSQIHLKDGVPHLCHTSCDLFDAGPLVGWLSEIKTWLDAHPSEVVTLLFVNDDKIPVSLLSTAFEDAGGLHHMGFVPDGSGTWPTLQEMIKSQRRVVTFLSQESDIAHTPYLLPEFDYVFETAFKVTDPAAFTCDADRPQDVKGKEKETKKIGLMNRFLYQELSKELKLYVVNDTCAAVLNGEKGVGALKDGVEGCANAWGRRGGFVLLDFVNEGVPMDIADAYNRVSESYNRDDFPKHPKKGGSSETADSSGTTGSKYGAGKHSAWERVQRLVEEIKEGKEVTQGQFIFASGKWMGAFDSRWAGWS